MSRISPSLDLPRENSCLHRTFRQGFPKELKEGGQAWPPSFFSRRLFCLKLFPRGKAPVELGLGLFFGIFAGPRKSDRLLEDQAGRPRARPGCGEGSGRVGRLRRLGGRFLEAAAWGGGTWSGNPSQGCGITRGLSPLLEGISTGKSGVGLWEGFFVVSKKWTPLSRSPDPSARGRFGWRLGTACQLVSGQPRSEDPMLPLEAGHLQIWGEVQALWRIRRVSFHLQNSFSCIFSLGFEGNRFHWISLYISFLQGAETSSNWRGFPRARAARLPLRLPLRLRLRAFWPT